jgi:hypothetical protein
VNGPQLDAETITVPVATCAADPRPPQVHYRYRWTGDQLWRATIKPTTDGGWQPIIHTPTGNRYLRAYRNRRSAETAIHGQLLRVCRDPDCARWRCRMCGTRVCDHFTAPGAWRTPHDSPADPEHLRGTATCCDCQPGRGSR